MRKIASWIGGIIVLLVILGMGIQSCTSKQVCDQNGLDCQPESECVPLLLDLIWGGLE
jgi:hypothetical protein